MSAHRRHLRLVLSTTNPEPQRQMVLVYAGLDADARGAETEPVATADEIVAVRDDPAGEPNGTSGPFVLVRAAPA